MLRGTQDPAWECFRFIYGTITLYGTSFQKFQLRSHSPYGSPTTPAMPKHYRFGLVPVRSPLLGESLLFSVPPGTEMFQFSGLASRKAGYHTFSVAGCPIRRSPDRRLFAPPRSLSQLITSFIAFRSQGIHRTPLSAFK